MWIDVDLLDLPMSGDITVPYHVFRQPNTTRTSGLSTSDRPAKDERMTPVPLYLIDTGLSLLWILINILLAIFSLRLSGRFWPKMSGSGKILNSAVVYCATIIVCLTALGTVHLFVRSAVLAAMLAIGLIGLYCVPPSPERPRTDRPSPAADARWQLFWTAMFALLCGHVIVDGLADLPTDYDCLMYHIPLVDHWIQAQSLYAPYSANWSLSANNELLAAWLAIPFSGDFLTPLNNVPVMIVWGAASIELARRLGMRGPWPHLTAIAILAVHTTFHETNDASNDLPVVAYCLAGAVFTLRYLATARKADLALFGISVGLLAGTKYFALGYAALLFGCFVIVAIWRRGWKKGAADLSIATMLMLLLGGYWYARNLVATGLPLYPMGFRDATSDLGYPDLWGTTFAGAKGDNVAALALQAVRRMCGPIQIGAVMVFPAFLLVTLLLALEQWRSRFRRRAVTNLLLLAWAVGSAGVLWITPFTVEDQPGTLNHLRWAYTPVRYGLCFLSYATFLFLSVICKFASQTPRRSRIAVWILAAVLIWQLLIERVVQAGADIDPAIVGTVGLTLWILALGGELLWSATERRHYVRYVLTACLVMVAAMGIGQLSSRWHANYASFYDARYQTFSFSRLERELPDDAVVMVLANQPYPTFGSRRQFIVVHPKFCRSEEQALRLAEQYRPAAIIAAQDHPGKINRYRGSVSAVDALESFEAADRLQSPQLVPFLPKQPDDER